MKAGIKNIFFIAIFLFLSGCSADRNLIRAINDPNDSILYADQIKRAQDNLSLCIGKNSNVLLENFGPPAEISKDVYYKGKSYDEEWYYYDSAGLPFVNQNSWAYIFYINDHIVESAVFL